MLKYSNISIYFLIFLVVFLSTSHAAYLNVRSNSTDAWRDVNGIFGGNANSLEKYVFFEGEGNYEITTTTNNNNNIIITGGECSCYRNNECYVEIYVDVENSLNKPTVGILAYDSFFECRYDTSLNNYSCSILWFINSGEELCWYEERNVFICNGIRGYSVIEDVFFGSTVYYLVGTLPLTLNFTTTPQHKPTDTQIKWSLTYYDDSNEWVNGDSCAQATSTTYIFAPLLNITNKYSPYKSINWSRGERLFPFFYVGDVVYFYPSIENVNDAFHNGRAFGVWRNITIKDQSIIQAINSTNLVVKDFYTGEIIPNTTTPLNHKIYFVGKVIGEGKTTLYYNISDYSGKYNDSVSFNVYAFIPRLDINTNKKTYNFGEKIGILTTIRNNATRVRNIYLNITKEEIINGKVINMTYTYDVQDLKVLDFVNDFVKDVFYTTYGKRITANSSGVYYIDVEVLLENYDAILKNSTTIYVLPGEVSVVGSQPTYRILNNQTGLFNITLQVENGDLHNLTLNISFSESNIRINNITTLINLGNLTNGSIIELTYNISTLKEGVVSYILNYTYTFNYSTFKTALDPIPLEVVNPKISVDFYIQNITQSNSVEIRVVGNMSKIKNAYLLLNKTLINDEITINYAKISTLTEDVCYAEESQTSSFATPVAIEEINVDYGNYSIDEDLTTYATFKTFLGSANITYNFSREFVFRALSLYVRASNVGEKLYVYYFNGTSYVPIPETKGGVNVNTELNYTNITLITPIKTQSIRVEMRGGSLVYLHEISFLLPTIISNYPCYVYNFTLFAKEHINTSGRYNVKGIVESYSSVSSTTSFDVRFGYPKIFLCPVYDIGNIYLSNENKLLEYVHIYPENGDLYDLEVNLTIDNTTLINITSTETTLKQINYLSYYNLSSLINTPCGDKGYVIKYNLTASTITNKTYTFINVSVRDFTNNIEIYNDTGIIELIPADIEKPTLSWWSFAYLLDDASYKEYNISNLYYDLKILINASDDVAVQEAYSKIIYPSGNIIEYNSTITKIWGAIDNGTFIFSIPYYMINETGEYVINLSVLDYAGNISQFYNKSINITDKIEVLLKRKANIYNRGQSYSIYFRLANGIESYERTNTTILINSTNTSFVACNEFLGCNSSNIYYSYEGITYYIPLNETPARYEVSISLNYRNNTGNALHEYETTNVLNTSLETFLSADATSIALIRVYVKYQNNIGEITNLENNSLTCNSAQYSLSYNPAGYFEPLGFNPCSLPATIEVYGLYDNNTAYTAKAVSSATQQPTQTSGGGGGGGGSSGGGGGGFFLPTNASLNATFIKDIKLNSFLNVNRLGTIQYQNTTFRLSLINTGNVDLSLSVNAKTTCERCYLEPIEKNMVVRKQRSKEIEYNLSVPFNQKPGLYNIEITIRDNTGEVDRKHNIDLIVDENPELSKLRIQKETLDRLISKAERYKELGLNVSSELFILSSNLELIGLLYEYYEKGDYKAFTRTMEKVMENNKRVEEMLKEKEMYAMLLENLDALITVALLSILFAGSFYFYVLPILYLSLKLKYLQRKLKIIIASRIETEKQYFVRKIDETTFRRLMEKQQDEIIKTRKEIERIKEELNSMAILKIIGSLLDLKVISKAYKELAKILSFMKKALIWKDSKLKESEKALIKMLVMEDKSHSYGENKSLQSVRVPKKKNVFYYTNNEVDST